MLLLERYFHDSQALLGTTGMKRLKLFHAKHLSITPHNPANSSLIHPIDERYRQNPTMPAPYGYSTMPAHQITPRFSRLRIKYSYHRGVPFLPALSPHVLGSLSNTVLSPPLIHNSHSQAAVQISACRPAAESTP